jgi:hypothetical protein
MEQYVEQLLANAVGAMSIGVVFVTIAIAAFLVTLLVVRSSDNS